MKKQDLRIVFMGTPEFAVPSLKALIDTGYNVVGVITAPDKQAGRGKKIKMSAVKTFALDNELNILQPYKLKDESFLNELTKLKCNLQIVVAFRMLPKVVWNMPELGTFNLHASLLPQYRGAAPINFALINGEKTTGLTTFFIDNKIDTGRIIKQELITISQTDDAGSLHDKMMQKGAKLVTDTVDLILSNKAITHEQKLLINEDKNLKSAHKIDKEYCRINWNNNANTIYNFIRGLSPYPAAFSELISSNGTKYLVKIYKTEIIPSNEQSQNHGEILTDGKTYLHVITNLGVISILELQLSGKKRMIIGDFLRGFQKIKDYKLK